MEARHQKRHQDLKEDDGASVDVDDELGVDLTALDDGAAGERLWIRAVLFDQRPQLRGCAAAHRKAALCGAETRAA